MFAFQYQVLVYIADERPVDVGVVLFDPPRQQLEYLFRSALVAPGMTGVVNYLEKEFSQMKEKMESGLTFSPFSSLQEITNQLLQGGQLFFAPQQLVLAPDIKAALHVLNLSLSP